MKQQERAAALFYSSKARVTHIRAPREDVSDCLHEVMQPMARLIKATQRRMFDAYYSLEGDLASILKVVQEQAERLLLHFCGDFQLTLNSMENAEDIELGHIGEDPRRDLIPDATWAEFNVQSSDAPLKEGKRRMVDEDLDDEEMDEMRLIPQPGFSSAGPMFATGPFRSDANVVPTPGAMSQLPMRLTSEHQQARSLDPSPTEVLLREGVRGEQRRGQGFDASKKQPKSIWAHTKLNGIGCHCVVDASGGSSLQPVTTISH
ncbi:hypothetical protein POSPLADRAFT_1035467 [Postia placenta MAD-698-R-SB12]|uniref:Uncharacterized protein n=1 Tax=Postia placenta MAD-698-R-SB12 TaxID=670580 RepID=A0A1X6MUD0_9APHY|nr:hypothetical protein POSPLADRAFT_1035467 [Postia placenta MAD-698-R-SB12]OSX59994.1 hypothetical protein POSPLADRAFT_1035467 [Postia placenta MAD-698-R-SB12]